jgi:ketosteroid isomerase-like protein
MAHEEHAICDLLDDFTRALYTKDAASAIAPLADDAVTFDLAPPLQHGPDVTHDPVRLEEWFATWKGPIVSEPGKRTIVVDNNVAYAYGLQRMTGIKTNGEKVELWFRAPATTPRLTSSQPEASTSQSADPDLQMEAMQLATNFILASGLRNPKVLSRQDTPIAFASFGAAWKSDEAVGAVKIVPPDGGQTKGLDVAAAIAAGDAAACKGKFASGRVSELIDSEVVFRGFSSCEHSDGARSVQFFVVPRKGGGFVIFSVASFETSASEPGSGFKAEEHLTGFQKAALTATQ